MTDETIAARVHALIEDCETALDGASAERQKALDYYDGKVPDLKAEDGMSTSVSPDVRSMVKKIMPSLMRSILTNDNLGKFEPVSPDHEEQADQASDYLNHVIVPESKAADAIYDAIHDAALLKTGALKWTAYERTKVVTSQHTGQSPDALLGLDEDGDVSDEETAEDGSVSFTLKRSVTRVDIRLEAVPRGALLIHPSAVRFEDSPLVGERLALTRSELVSRGYDRATVYALKTADENADKDDDERRDDDVIDAARSVSKAMELVRIWDCYVQLDLDDDGIAETHHVVMAEGSKDGDTKGTILKREAAPEVPYAAIVIERSAHQFEGRSLAEDLIPTQKTKTSLLREMLNNLYQSNSPQPWIEYGSVMDYEAVLNPSPGRPVWTKEGINPATAVTWKTVPFVAEKSFAMMDYFDRQAEDATGVSDTSGGLDLEQLQDVTATAAALASDTSVAQSELMLRQIAPGIKRACEGLLRLTVAHADRARIVRLRGEWVEFDPRSWDAEMQFTVNIGLGAGSRQRDMVALSTILGIQKEFVASAGLSNPLVTPQNLYNTVSRIVEAAGFASPDPYFNKPTPEMLEQMNQQGPSEAEIKAQQEQAKAETQRQIEQAKAEARAAVEQAQMNADLVVQNAKIEAERERARMQADHDAEMKRMQVAADMRKHSDQMELEWFKVQQPATVTLPDATSGSWGAI